MGRGAVGGVAGGRLGAAAAGVVVIGSGMAAGVGVVVGDSGAEVVGVGRRGERAGGDPGRRRGRR